jgi:hypothetical protein
MKWRIHLLAAACIAVGVMAAAIASTLLESNERLLGLLQQVHGLTPDQVQRLAAIFRRSGVMGQGNPAISVHPMTPDQCLKIRKHASFTDDLQAFRRICGAPNMAPLFDPKTTDPGDAPVCIDQFEFPDIACEYPVVWTRASEAAAVCEAMGKRLCDAHEWEGACEGQLTPPDYRFDLVQGLQANGAIHRMRIAHNQSHAGQKRWSYGMNYQSGVCGTASHKTANCLGGGWNACGSNTFPAGAFPACRSTLGVYDLHGNAAEHMNLPLSHAQMSSLGSRTLGYTEMKGSWFVFDDFHAHEDWCRWRAPFWHGSRVLDGHSHANYHLGFRCCKTLTKP